MKVFKFGGASVKDAEAVKNAARIIQSYENEKILVIVSAMGKITNAFEEVLGLHLKRDEAVFQKLENIKKFHFKICEELFESKTNLIFQELHNTFVEAEWQIEDEPIGSYGFEYDQLIGLGELLSTKIISAYLIQINIDNTWLDARDVVRTDNNYRNATVDWEETTRLVTARFTAEKNNITITQGFIGSSSENFTTTLGREGSDFSAAIFANALTVEEVVIWKDVDGMLNADPKFYEKTVKLENISYKEAVELAYFGASVIHPKTIKPLQNKNIPLYVKSFVHPKKEGTLINHNSDFDYDVPSYIHKKNQLLISITSEDYSFMDESTLANIFQLFSDLGVNVNIMQNSALSFSVAIDDDVRKTKSLLEKLTESYKVTFNRSATLITIRHFTDAIIEQLIVNKTILLEQRTRSTARFVLA